MSDGINVVPVPEGYVENELGQFVRPTTDHELITGVAETPAEPASDGDGTPIFDGVVASEPAAQTAPVVDPVAAADALAGE